MGSHRNDILQAAQAFCATFAEKRDIDDILTHFSTTREPVVFEHGLLLLAPFLGRRFTGEEGVRSYFKIISDLLSYDDMTFTEFLVDEHANKVTVRANAKFTWLSTRESWPETFLYILEFDVHCKVVVYEIWADSGAAYLASRGQLSKGTGESVSSKEEVTSGE
jgi:hypothetical protein